MWKRILLGVTVLILVAGGGFYAWASQTNPILPAAQAALSANGSDGSGASLVQVAGRDWLVYKPAGKDTATGLIFYPGGKVDYRAYAPYARAVAEQGFLVVIPRMPLNLAVLDSNEAANIIQSFPQVNVWAVGGHSLGGSMAAHYAAQNSEQVRGLVLLASYPASSDSLRDANIKALSIYATHDGLATVDKIDASRPLLPPDTQYVAIQGGNHGQFGYYGLQSGDGPAEISRAEQQRQTVDATVQFLHEIAAESFGLPAVAARR